MTRPVTFVHRLARRGTRSLLVAVMLVASPAQAQPAQPAQPAQSAQPRQVRTPPSAAQQRRAARAVELFDKARSLYEKGEYRKAIVKLKEALELDPEAKLLIYNLAVIHEKLAEVDDAERYYRHYLELETDAKIIERVQGILKRIEGAKKELARAKAAAEEAKKPPPPPVVEEGPPFSPWVIATGALAAGALVVGTGFGISAVARDPGKNVQTQDGVTLEDLQSDAQTAHDHAVVADVALIVAGLAAGTAAFLYFAIDGSSSTKAPDSAPAAGVALGVGPGRAVLQVRF
jgi:tetratricopeptide (TPR) repeat protein